MSCDIKTINLGTLQNGVYPEDNDKTYLYKRTNGHIYLYKNGNETHACCDDGLINKVPIFSELPSVQPPTHTPNDKFVYLFKHGENLYYYDNDDNVVKINIDINALEWAKKEW